MDSKIEAYHNISQPIHLLTTSFIIRLPLFSEKWLQKFTVPSNALLDWRVAPKLDIRQPKFMKQQNWIIDLGTCT